MYVTFLNPSMCVEKLREVGSHLARAGPGLVEGGVARTLVVDCAEVPERHVSDPPLVCAHRTGDSCKRYKAKDAIHAKDTRQKMHAKDTRQKMHAPLQNTGSTQHTVDVCNTIVRTRHAPCKTQRGGEAAGRVAGGVAGAH